MKIEQIYDLIGERGGVVAGEYSRDHSGTSPDELADLANHLYKTRLDSSASGYFISFVTMFVAPEEPISLDHIRKMRTFRKSIASALPNTTGAEFQMDGDGLKLGTIHFNDLVGRVNFYTEFIIDTADFQSHHPLISALLEQGGRIKQSGPQLIRNFSLHIFPDKNMALNQARYWHGVHTQEYVMTPPWMQLLSGLTKEQLRDLKKGTFTYPPILELRKTE